LEERPVMDAGGYTRVEDRGGDSHRMRGVFFRGRVVVTTHRAKCSGVVIDGELKIGKKGDWLVGSRHHIPVPRGSGS